MEEGSSELHINEGNNINNNKIKINYFTRPFGSYFFVEKL
jgi:hypothetical protein